MARARTSSRSVRRVEADAALGRTAGQVVLHPVPGEHLDPPVVRVSGTLTVIERRGHPEQLVHAVVETQLPRRVRELDLSRFPGRLDHSLSPAWAAAPASS